jgi:hypothetical protein
MTMDEPEPVPTERVAPAMSSPLLHERDVSLTPPAGVEIPPAVAGHPSWMVEALVAAVIGLAATVVSGDPRVGLVLGAVVGFAGLIRSADRRLPFSFGEGFVGYRADLGWPRGVQEDDDVHWAWRAAR